MKKSLSYFLLKPIFWVMGHVPLSILHAIGRGLGLLIFILPIRLRYYAARNIQLCFPQLSETSRRQLLKVSLQEVGKTLMEMPVFFVRSQAALVSLVTKTEGLEDLLAAVEEKKGVILLGSHMGAYYLCNAYLGQFFRNKSAWLYKPQESAVETFMLSQREKYGIDFFETSTEGVLNLYRILRRGYIVGLSCDHIAPTESSLYAPFFGINVPSMTLAAKLIQRSKVPVFMSFMERSVKGTYTLHITKAPSSIYSEDLLSCVSAMNQMIEDNIRRYPSQHEWLYRRFWEYEKTPYYHTQGGFDNEKLAPQFREKI
jgi:KDO2-lipid IV(A) lauroyltransferase